MAVMEELLSTPPTRSSDKATKTISPKPAEQTVKMKYIGHFKGTQKRVSLPIPLISNSQKLEQELVFERESDKRGPAYCQVPMEWAGALLAVGGSWQAAEKITPELQQDIDRAKDTCDAKMRAFALENQTEAV
jgi:hypothetical protein